MNVLSSNSIVVASEEHIFCPLLAYTAILNLKNNVYYELDPVGTRIWNLLQEQRSVAEIRDALLNEYEVDAEQCERNLFDLLEIMQAQGLIEVRGFTDA